ncbi:MAG: bifunctional DNA-formamidopyrimidine glycosylase/DNA-(apurinic or apyrimidinic site) lyase [Ancalomicrobiaceae bacterium]|nr:bifunctional DNA-formamidopyrimidine glycosylase/DNA-(apurinic or apyrimidinic site) lyase [Ancalomicrobiaceae bacterium]
MPELPEVETVRRGLGPILEGALIERVELRRPNLRFPFPDDFAARLTGRTVVALGRRAKYLIADLDDSTVLVMHLGMSGSFRILAGAAAGGGTDTTETPGDFHLPRGKSTAHDHVVFHLRTPADGCARIVYNDPRRFGFMTLVERAAFDAHPLMRDIGIEPLGNLFGAGALAEVFAGKTAPLKAALLDQKLIAGLGNIYVCEALWRAELSPTRAAGTIAAGRGARARAEALAASIRSVLQEAIAAGGSTLRDHVQASGELGYFQHRFNVYDREGEACLRPGCGGVVERLTQSGRSTFWCPTCQK